MANKLRDVFFPPREKLEKINKEIIEHQKLEIEEKRCRMCIYSYDVPQANHGHTEYIGHCKLFDEILTDFSNGQKCLNWAPREIITLEKQIKEMKENED